ncbi:hypothetical protein ACFO4E_17630 [Nocardiopsis mangrovi]|uniref:Alpha/beta hydrolase n=1 Tax=Nocardiopsis mangrovi TaxID=1179818 RepID=A0ABV9DZ10_9ACTN
MSTAVVLLHSPLFTAAQWGGLPGDLRALGAHVTVPEITDDDRPPYAARYIARASLEIAEHAPGGPLLLVAAGAAGPLLPGIGAARRAAHRPPAGYVLIDALLPQPGAATREALHAAQAAPHAPSAPADAAVPAPGHPAGAAATAPRPRPAGFYTEQLPSVADWPDAPCGYLYAGVYGSDGGPAAGRDRCCSAPEPSPGWPAERGGEVGAGGAPYGPGGERGARLAALRGWPVEHAPGATGADLARALLGLASRM